MDHRPNFRCRPPQPPLALSLNISPATPVDIRSILTSTPPAHVAFSWTDAQDRTTLSEQPEWLTVGSAAWEVKLNNTSIVDVETGEPLRGHILGSSFNLAVLKLPPGSRWGFVGVARGPTLMRDWVKVKDVFSREQMLVG